MASTIQKMQVTEVSEAQIAVHWKEEEYYYPSEKFILLDGVDSTLVQ